MFVNASNLSTLFIAFKAAFMAAFGSTQSLYNKVATTVPSTTGTEEYGWLGAFPRMREWLGDRVIHGAKAHGYSIRNKSFELTVAVPRPSVEDDGYGIYTPMISELGQAAAQHPDELVFALLAAGPTTPCYDGQYFFDTDHPVLDADGVVQSQSNWNNNGGSGTAWYLLDCSRSLKPLIFQERKKPQFVSKTAITDDNVFHSNEFVYGVDSRCNVGFGFWQMAQGSRAALTEENLIAAFTAMTSRTGDYGKKLALRPNVLLVPPELEWTARKLVNATTLANGADNVLKGVVEVVSAPWLS